MFLSLRSALTLMNILRWSSSTNLLFTSLLVSSLTLTRYGCLLCFYSFVDEIIIENVILFSVLNVCVLLCVQLLLEHQDALCPDQNDALFILLRDLGKVPSVQALVG